MTKYFLVILALHLALVPKENLGCAIPSLICKKLALGSALGLCDGGAYGAPVYAPQQCCCSPIMKYPLGLLKLELFKQKLALKKLAALETLGGCGCGC